MEPGLTYLAPIVGGTTPLASDRGGGIWVINAAREGIVRMDFARHGPSFSINPFQAGNDSIRLDVRDFNVAPDPPIARLGSVFYVVPGRNSTMQTGLPGRDGALAMFAEREFLFVSPFDRTLFFHQRLRFDPVWTGEDPASAGEMFVQPQERTSPPFPGLPGPDVGPYHYFYAADSSHLAVFETTYVHRLDPTPPSGRLVFAANASLAAPPLVFYDQDMVNPLENFRAGPGQAVLLPLTNRTVEITNVTGKVKTWLPLILDGQPAEIAGPIGFVRTSYPVWVYMPLRSSSSTGIVALDLATLTPAFQYSMPGTLLDVVGTPTSYRGTFLFLGLYDATTDTTQFVGLNETGARLPSFGATVAGRAVTYFETDELSRLFVQSKGGAVVTLRTRGGTAGEPPQEFSIRPPSAESWLMYAGSPGGTLYGAALIPQELVGAWTDSASARTALFELLGVPQPQPTVSTDGLRGTPAGIPSATWMIDASLVITWANGVERRVYQPRS